MDKHALPAAKLARDDFDSALEAHWRQFLREIYAAAPEGPEEKPFLLKHMEYGVLWAEGFAAAKRRELNKLKEDTAK